MEKVFTIGFTRKTAAQFFGALKTAGVRRVVDVRLHNASQLAGFAKRADLEFFLKEICGADYVHEPRLAPPQDLLDAYKKKECGWQDYERRFFESLAERRVEAAVDPALFAVPTALLCSEATADHCHRRLVLEYLRTKWGDFPIEHL
jgi:uncharacterized protein (DUF488 family)